ncbi:class I SAM-dependent methyltransferase [bacterium]|nr:class I SAM-dependent methyltransferase [bacterium]
MPIERLIQHALDTRGELIIQLQAENTDTCRLFHGSNEGFPGLTIDRYGDQVLVQTFYEPLSETNRSIIETSLVRYLGFKPGFNFRDRSGKKKDTPEFIPPPGSEAPNSPLFCMELGVHYLVRQNRQGLDPYLFLDMRSARRFILKNSRHLSVLNLFAYTCSLGLCAALGGADEVWNIDFADSALKVGQANLERNGAAASSHRFIHADFFPAVRQLAALPIKGRGKRKKQIKLDPRMFDLVILDPPRWATSIYGAVDLVRDYQSVFKPALLVTKPGGRLICTNHVPSVNCGDWLEMLKRCAMKTGVEIDILEIIAPEADFPSPDGQHPLKIAVIGRNT